MEIDPRSLRVYVVTSAGPRGRDHEEVAAAALEGGATAIQLRAPELDDEQLLALAMRLADRCRTAGVPFIVNDRVEVAATGGADGAHVGQDDDPRSARRRLGSDRILGVSVGSPAEAVAAHRAGADYLGVTVWATTTKPEATPRGPEVLREVVTATPLPVVGIGGIGPANAAEVLATGAAGVAVISAVSSADEPVRAVRALVAAVEAYRTSEAPAHG